jgi:hypothetical protein
MFNFFAIGFKDFVFAIFQIQNLNGIHLSEKYWIIQIMIFFYGGGGFSHLYVIMHKYIFLKPKMQKMNT